MTTRSSISTRATGWQQSLCIWLSALMLFASMAPGFSRMLHAGLFSSASAEHCADAEGEHASHAHHAHHVQHSEHSEHQSGSPEHADGIHCPFCLLFQHLPIIGAGQDTAIGQAADKIIGSIRFSTSFLPNDSARRWLQWQKHGPPFL